MIERSFTFLDGIGEQGEENLHSQGVLTWTDFLAQSDVKGMSYKRKAFYDRRLRQAQRALMKKDHEYFLKILPQKHTWRLYNTFKSEALYLDIEIDQRGSIILVGLYDGFDTKILVKGVNLEGSLLQSELDKYKMIITFNGSAFDLPKLKKRGIKLNALHMDLKHACQKLGLGGGLKEVELQLNLNRPQHLRGNPIDLWKAFHASGDREYLDLLIRYNEEDIVNLKPLAERCYRELAQIYAIKR